MNKEYKQLKEGKYFAKVESVNYKNGKDVNGNEDKSKEIINLKLNVKDQDEFYYINFCVKGYSAEICEKSNKAIDKMVGDFEVSCIDEMKDKIGILTVKENDNGSTSMYLDPKKDFFKWETVLSFDGEAKFPCEVLKIYKSKLGNKYNFITKATVNGQEIEEYVTYDLKYDFKVESLNWALKKLDLTLEDCDKDLTGKSAYLVVKRVTKGDKVYFNKRLGFEKKQKERPQPW